MHAIRGMAVSLSFVPTTRAGKPVAELRPVRKMNKRSIPLDDRLLRVDEYNHDGPIGSTTNRDIGSIVCDV